MTPTLWVERVVANATHKLHFRLRPSTHCDRSGLRRALRLKVPRAETTHPPGWVSLPSPRIFFSVSAAKRRISLISSFDAGDRAPGID